MLASIVTDHFTPLLAVAIGLTACASAAQDSDIDDIIASWAEPIASPSPTFVVLGYATELEYLGTADEYFESYGGLVTTALASRVSVDIVSNVVGYTDRDTLDAIILLGHPRDVDPKLGPIFVVGREGPDGVETLDWGRPRSLLCLDADVANAEDFPDYRVDELGRYDPENPRRHPKSNAGDFVLMEDDPDPLDPTDLYSRNDGREVCVETEYGIMDGFADLRSNLKRTLEIAD